MRATGPKATEAGYASVCEAFGGFRHLNGYPDRPPVRPNISLGDTLAGLHAAFGTVMALLHKHRHGGPVRKGGGRRQSVNGRLLPGGCWVVSGCGAEWTVATGWLRGCQWVRS